MNKKLISLLGVIILLPVMIIYSATTGSIDVTSIELIKGLYTHANENVDITKDLRFARVIVSLIAGVALAFSGVLLQAVMRDPLAVPGIIGVSSGAGFMSLLVSRFLP